jgi:hypothetical protein
MARLMSAAALAATVAFHGAAHGSNPCKVGGHAASNAQHQPDKNLQYSANDVEVVVHRGLNGGTLTEYVFNPVDKPASMHCESAGGCLLIAHATANAPASGGSFLCTFVDGKPLDQRWEQSGADFTDALVTTGDHRVQTKLWPYNPGPLASWAITYTMYDQRAGARIGTPTPAN